MLGFNFLRFKKEYFNFLQVLKTSLSFYFNFCKILYKSFSRCH